MTADSVEISRASAVIDQTCPRQGPDWDGRCIKKALLNLSVHRHFLGEAVRPDVSQEGNVMVPVASLFNQLLQHFPRTEFAGLVRKHKAEQRAKGFTCWTQFVSMLFCQLAHAGSLRDICNGLSCSLGKLVHL